jgi:hypothetical protein
MSKTIKTTALLLLVSGVAIASYPQVGIGVKVSRNLFDGSIGNDTLAMRGVGVTTEFLLALNRCFSFRTDIMEFRTNEGSSNSFRFNSFLSTDMICRLPLNGRFVPYLYGGLGFAVPRFDPLLDFRVGIGAEYRFARKWKLFAEDELFKMVGISQEQLNGGEFVGGAHAKISAGVRFGGG